jgi:hypothetical protein
MRSECRFLSALCLAVVLVGASCSSKPTTYPVTGIVRFEDGRPVPYGAIEFRNEQTGQSARGQLDTSGKSTLGTFTSSDGAPAGNYRVIVAQFFNPQSNSNRVRMHDDHRSHDAGADARVAAAASDFSTSPLRAEVTPKNDNHFSFTVQRHTPTHRPARTSRNSDR